MLHIILHLFFGYLLTPAKRDPSSFGSFSSENFKKDFLQISDSAAKEIRSRIAMGGFEPRIGVRIAPDSGVGANVSVSFDYPLSDGRDWLSEVQGFVVLVDKVDEALLAGRRIDFAANEFIAY